MCEVEDLISFSLGFRKNWYLVLLRRFSLWTCISVGITTPVKTVFWLRTRTVPGLSLGAPRLTGKTHTVDFHWLHIFTGHLRNIPKINT